MTESKILTREQVVQRADQWRADGQQIVFTNGCFDIVHLGHIDYLEKARSLGQRLILGLNTDTSVSCIKGPLRPVVNEYARARLMAALEFIDAVTLFGEPTPLELIEAVQPDVLVKGDDYTVDTIVGADFVLARGGRVETVALVPGYSTSKLIERIKQSY
ncbi:D-glycero-beta-D-manno-heptose 1-phosphate adenylyltransferase [Spirosoma utsteinense]|uniref:D-glycero-beta-D-manno-heptose 1-phosphate adenylyltransferase n=1 Tax=Spirosoma utsteinense TaxID=2585773 RepID=A0ABR6WCI4_9BACT|nr:D-glycero-beta-D-manno-heptose 1-phosphate adenylyltransferase [Spirosoma utsteinense]MBC3787843.1 rfaE bifunctional protein nucleotidyltransferase chain/domain [Spirosoma utsteinense]MBC3793631.1 rfaE bifunctional protein nucleotidyltransferase chain/domain [Spirosoma utsteinense]